MTGLDWDEVKPLVEKQLGDLSIPVYIYVTYQKGVKANEAPKQSNLGKGSSMSQFDNVNVIKKGNVFFDGKCVSHSVLFADGSRKTLGVIQPGTLTFNVSTPELMGITSGTCRVKNGDEPEFKTYTAGDQFSVAENSGFVIEANEVINYVWSFG